MLLTICRLEVLGAGSINQFLGCAPTVPSSVHVCLWSAVDSVSFLLLEQQTSASKDMMIGTVNLKM